MAKAKSRIAKLVEDAEILVLASHDFSALKNFCTRGLVFHQGQIIFDGQVSDAINEYKKVNNLK
ncbi:hypothetical protein [Pseudomonas sp. Pc102]|uniref:hypothetical protein n=1 Tax=Pseudomonas sp. Pc102 TaxID=2678261 RepID=UPI001FD42209|nr:hypothetical protein [Pseudomonas sp. Pc102]